MKVDDKTSFETQDLKTLIKLCCQHEGIYVDKVYVKHSKHARGSAAYRGNFFFLGIPRPGPKLDWLKIVAIICHELSHTTGVKHNEMASHLKLGLGWEKEFEWARPYLSIRTKQKSILKRDIKEERYEHAKKILKQKQIQALRLQQQQNKWRRKVRYYESKVGLKTFLGD